MPCIMLSNSIRIISHLPRTGKYPYKPKDDQGVTGQGSRSSSSECQSEKVKSQIRVMGGGCSGSIVSLHWSVHGRTLAAYQALSA